MKLPLDFHPKYWIKRKKSLENIPDRDILLDMLYESIDDMTCSLSTGNLMHDIFEFLCRHGYSPEELISDRQFSKYKGGPGLAKRIRTVGREEVREMYDKYIKHKLSTLPHD